MQQLGQRLHVDRLLRSISYLHLSPPHYGNEMAETFLASIEATTIDGEHVRERTDEIHDAVLDESRYMKAANFTSIHPEDVERLFDHYDHHFFGGKVRETLDTQPLSFRLSSRMTSSGGSTARRTNRDGRRQYEIAVSTELLFGCFRDDDHRSIVVGGVPCLDRLEALQRVMEHEITHLIEMLLWEKSSCSKSRFQEIAHRFFTHTDHRHRLITPREKVQEKYGILPGMTVKFRVDGAEFTGVVNRVTKRATVLVERGDGARYSDGKHYAKYYVPPRMLEIVDG